MNCPTCDHLMEPLNVDRDIRWCPRCGTLREDRGAVVISIPMGPVGARQPQAEIRKQQDIADGMPPEAAKAWAFVRCGACEEPLRPGQHREIAGQPYCTNCADDVDPVGG